MYRSHLKRAIDFIGAFFMLLLLAVPFLFIALIIRIDSKGPVFFVQDRLGKDEVPFSIYKFRTMYTYAPNEVATGDLVNSRALITRVGRILRKTSIDELPQLLNILLGDMSFVGYRPLILSETATHDERRKRNVYSVLPGITGLAQVRGRDELDPVEKASYDGIYVKNISLGYDFRILLKTVTTVLYSTGYREGGE